MEIKKVLPIVRSADVRRWFVMRDLTRHNAKYPAYKLLEDMKIEIFTPMVHKLVVRQGKRVPVQVPFMQDLLFVHDSRRNLDPIVERISTLQYRFLRDGYRTPMTVRDEDMEHFIHAVKSSLSPRFYKPQEVTSDMIGKRVRIIGGPFDGHVGALQKLQGSRVKRLFVELADLLIVSVEVDPEYIQLLEP